MEDLIFDDTPEAVETAAPVEAEAPAEHEPAVEQQEAEQQQESEREVVRKKKSASERIQEITWARHEAERRAARQSGSLLNFAQQRRLNPLRQPQGSRRLTSSRTMTATSKRSPNGGPERLCAPP